MTFTERRHAENAQLREKINHIQQVSQQLQTLVQQVQVETVAWAREGQETDLPSPELAHRLSASFQQQGTVLALIQHEIKGAAARAMKPASSPLITGEELVALMK